MAEGLAKHLGGGNVRAYSAGTRAFGEIVPMTYEVMQEKGITLDGQWSKGLEDVPLSEMDIVVEMGNGVKCHIPEDFKGRVIEWNIPDPYGHDKEIYCGVLEMIEAQVQALIDELAGEPGDSKPEGGALAPQGTVPSAKQSP